MSCITCRRRIRPPKRSWTFDRKGKVSYYASSPLKPYHQWLEKLFARIPVAHEGKCWEERPVERCIMAWDLQSHLAQEKRLRI